MAFNGLVYTSRNWVLGPVRRAALCAALYCFGEVCDVSPQVLLLSLRSSSEGKAVPGADGMDAIQSMGSSGDYEKFMYSLRAVNRSDILAEPLFCGSQPSGSLARSPGTMASIGSRPL